MRVSRQRIALGGRERVRVWDGCYGDNGRRVPDERRGYVMRTFFPRYRYQTDSNNPSQSQRSDDKSDRPSDFFHIHGFCHKPRRAAGVYEDESHASIP